MILHSRPYSWCEDTTHPSVGFNTEEDSGYHSDSSLPGDLWHSTNKKSETEPEVPVKNEVTDNSVNEEQQNNKEYSVGVEGKSDCSSTNTKDTEIQEESQSNNPFMTQGVHGDLWCCTNGFFRVLTGPFSEFESNCSCTTRTLVDWSTRPVWSSRHVRHQYKIREVTHLSPYRTQPRVFPAPLVYSYGSLSQAESTLTAYMSCHSGRQSTSAFPRRESTTPVAASLRHRRRESTPSVHHTLTQSLNRSDNFLRREETQNTGTPVNIKQEVPESSQHLEGEHPLVFTDLKTLRFPNAVKERFMRHCNITVLCALLFLALTSLIYPLS